MHGRLPLSILALAITACAAPVNHAVSVSYYGVNDFSVTPAITHLAPGDTVTFSSDDPAGTLLLRLGDDGQLYKTQGNRMTFTARQILAAGVDKIRCSMLLDDDTMLGWESIHHGKRQTHSQFIEADEVTPGSEAVNDKFGGTIIVDLSVPTAWWGRIRAWFGGR